MGWTHSVNWQNLDDVVCYRTRTQEGDAATYRTLAHAVAKESARHVLWSVKEVEFHKDCNWGKYKAGDKERYIACDLLRSIDGQWGYKDMDESMFPAYYSCPLEYLDMAQHGANEHWRANVREYHAAKRARRKFNPIDDAAWAARQAQGALFAA